MNFFRQVIEYPAACKTRASRIAYWIYWQNYQLNMGRHLINFFSNPLPDLMAAIYLFDKFTGITITGLNILWIILAVVVFAWFGGLLYMRHHLDVIEGLVTQQRQHMQKDIYNMVHELYEDRFGKKGGGVL